MSSRSLTVLLTMGLINGCLLSQPSPAAYPTLPSQAPTHAPTTEAKWGELEQQAEQLATTDGAKLSLQPTRLSKTGFNLEHRIELRANTCYTMGVSWAFPGKAQVSVNYIPGADGSRPNKSLAGTGEKLSEPGGIVRFCADAKGEANLGISAIDAATGAIRNNELLEYAVAIAAVKERPAETKVRRKKEAARADQRRGEIAGNIAAAKERERRDKELKRRRALQNCTPCRSDFTVCMRSRPRVSVNWHSKCASKFNKCVFDGAIFADDEVNPCGAP